MQLFIDYLSDYITKSLKIIILILKLNSNCNYLAQTQDRLNLPTFKFFILTFSLITPLFLFPKILRIIKKKIQIYNQCFNELAWHLLMFDLKFIKIFLASRYFYLNKYSTDKLKNTMGYLIYLKCGIIFALPRG